MMKTYEAHNAKCGDGNNTKPYLVVDLTRGKAAVQVEHIMFDPGLKALGLSTS